MAKLSDQTRNIIATILAVTLVNLLLFNHFRKDRELESDFQLDSSSTLSRAGLNLVGSSNSNSDTLSQAVDILSQATLLDPKDPLALFGLGWALQKQKKSDLALVRYNQALQELNELTSFSLFNRSFIKEERGDLSGALADVIAALALAPDFEIARTRESQLRKQLNL